MQAHIVGGGFGGLAAAALSHPQRRDVRRRTSPIYEADELLGGASSSAADAASGYNLPRRGL